ncbi:MAG: C39 family peptidase [Candidatus Thorarchaeota archaeon]
MKIVRNKIGIIIILAVILSTSAPRASETSSVSFMEIDHSVSAEAGEVTGVPYVWQELNGFCHWATLSMALQSIGIQLDLGEVFAASGAGFTAGYVRYEDFWVFLSGSSYRQQSNLATFANLLGFEVEFYADTDSTDYGPPFSLTMQSHNVNWTEIDGWNEAFQILKSGIDNGFPAEIYVNLQNLPASDYELFRDLGITDTDPTHSILVTGYNETSGTAQIMDPAIGLFDDPATFPDDGSWFYEINFTSLNQAWLGVYGTAIIKPGSGTIEDFTQNLVNLIVDRLRGDRNSYASPGSDDAFFWNYGSNAFRAMAADLTDTGLSSYMDEFDEYNLQTRSIIFQNLGLGIETSLTQQYATYRAAIDALPSVLPDLDLQEFVTEAELALEHFELFSDNSTLNTPFYPAGIKMVTETFEKIAYQYEYVSDGDLSSAASVYEEDLAEIRTHLIAIADAWDSAADALERVLHGEGSFPIVLLSMSIAGFLVLVLVIIRRSR